MPVSPHVHFGAGNLGLGLLVPALARNRKPLVVVQRKSDAWKHVEHGVSLDHNINGRLEADTSLEVCGCPADISSDRSLLLTEDVEAWRDVASQAATLSCSIGSRCDEVVVEALQHLPYSSDPPELFAFENDLNTVEKMRYALSGKVDVVPCTVDRICYHKKIGNGEVSVFTEKHEGTVVSLRKAPPMAMDLNVVGDKYISLYYHTEKQYFVNSIQTLYAMLTAVNNGGINGRIDVDAVDAKVIDHWKVACVIAVLNEWGTFMPCKAMSCDPGDLPKILISRVEKAASRVYDVGGMDKASRILRKGPMLCYVERMMPVIRAFRCSSMTWEQSLVYAAYNTSQHEVLKTIKMLSRKSERFCM